jgi:serine phosphatase RsbU (regulator of sigma subunit)
MKKIIYAICLITCSLPSLFAQQFADKNYYLVDSLLIKDLSNDDKILIDTNLKHFHTTKIDTSKVKIIFTIIDNCYDENVWPKYNKWVLDYIEGLLKNKPNSKTSFLKIKKSDAINNIGYWYQFRGDIPNALNFYHSALKIREAQNDTSGISNSFNNIGLVYYGQGDFEKALTYYFKSLELRLIQNDPELIFNSYNNIASTYNSLDSLDKALYYYNICLDILNQTSNNRKKSLIFNSLASIYKKQDNLEKALESAFKSLEIRLVLNDRMYISQSYTSIAQILLQQKKIKGKEGALEFALKGHEIALEINFPAEIRGSSLCLSEIYAQLGNATASLEMYKLYIEKRDEIKNIETDKAAIKSELQYEYEKKAAADSVANAKDKIIKDAEIAKQKAELNSRRLFQYGLVGGIILILLFLFILFNRLKVTQKQKRIIEIKEKQTQHQNAIIRNQKLLVEEKAAELAHKHKEITDSINYAERIQRSFLASTELLNTNLTSHSSGGNGDYFVFFQPKDVVSGDFYWARKLDNNEFIICVADSTGHGVPGAIMSILNISSLENASERNSSPDVILNEARKIIIDRLKKDGSEKGGKDGMDCALISINNENGILKMACAQNHVWIVRNKELLEFKGDKMPVGKHDNDEVPFTLQTFQGTRGDIIYCSTDGFPDQFGGEKGKKFMSKQLKEILIQISDKPMVEQKSILSQTFNDWKGNNEQIDDVCIIGVRL